MGDLFAHRRRLNDRSQLLGVPTHGVFHIFLEHGVELIGTGEPFAGNAHDETAGLSALDVVDLQQMPQQELEILLGDPVEIAERQHTGCQCRRCHFAAGCQGTHGLVVEQAVGQPVQPWRLDPALFQIDLYQGNAL